MPPKPSKTPPPAPGFQSVYQTKLGTLFQGDCLLWLRSLPEESVDLVFADPPFNLSKDYGPGVSDRMRDAEYLSWSTDWLTECIRVLRPGGALFVFNLPRWCIEYGALLNRAGMQFRHWIACRMPKSMPIPKRLSPSHYGLLYYTKGSPKAFNVVRQPVQTCRHCGGEVRDYGGHRDKLNPDGLRLQDFFDAPDEVWESAPFAMPKGAGWTRLDELWEDIPPVRHARHKHRAANALAPLLLERVVAMASNPGDLVVDPFGGTGTTFAAAERLGRRWAGIELGDTAPAVQRLESIIRGEVPTWESARGGARGAEGRSRDRTQLGLLGRDT